MERYKILEIKKEWTDDKNLCHRPSYYMRTSEDVYRNKKLEQISSIETDESSFPKVKEYKINLDKIKTLEEAKEVLHALNIKIALVDGEILDSEYDMNVLMKYIDIKDLQVKTKDFNEIRLEFEDGVVRLTGLELGVDVYEAQVKDKVDYSKKNIIVIPNEIEDVAIAFVQGLTKGIFNNIRKDEFHAYFEIRGKQKLVDKIIKSIYF